MRSSHWQESKTVTARSHCRKSQCAPLGPLSACTPTESDRSSESMAVVAEPVCLRALDGRSGSSRSMVGIGCQQGGETSTGWYRPRGEISWLVASACFSAALEEVLSRSSAGATDAFSSAWRQPPAVSQHSRGESGRENGGGLCINGVKKDEEFADRRVQHPMQALGGIPSSHPRQSAPAPAAGLAGHQVRRAQPTRPP